MSQQTPGGRIAVIDAIRGFAVLGILLANIQSWSGYKFLPFEYTQQLPYYQWDYLLNQLDHWLVDGRFYAIFSMLFGVGFGIQYLKNRDRQTPFISTYRRRLVFLLLFGVMHAMLWSGDILTLYALLAFVLVSLRNLSDRAVLCLAVALLALFLVPQTLMMLLGEPGAIPSAIAPKVYPDVSPAEVSHAFARGSWAEVFSMNLHNLYWRWLDFLPNGRISRVMGMFLLGFWLARTGYFYEKVFQWHRILLFGALGLACTYIAQLLGGNLSYWARQPVDLLSKPLMVSAQVFTALAYMSIIASIYRQAWGERFLYPLTQIGRTAFTSYLSQSVIGIAIFYGVGFGFYGTMGLAQLWVLALAIFAAQVAMMSLWLRYFKQGPVEWAWRCLTQKRWIPNRRISQG
jgi:uncharacterized protein